MLLSLRDEQINNKLFRGKLRWSVNLSQRDSSKDNIPDRAPFVSECIYTDPLLS